MSSIDWDQAERYRERFSSINRVEPYDYQVNLAAELVKGNNVALRAPTGSGKTKAVLTPFVLDDLEWPGRPTRLIYALPLRSLVQQIHAEAEKLVKEAGHENWRVTIQTGEQPDDEFFANGRIIVTTYDQVLSGLLCAPYGLSRKLRNLNAAAVAGALVVFDEFHLMGIQSALLTGAAGLRLFRGLTQSVWMTATATEAPRRELSAALDCVPLSLSDDETRKLPVVAKTTRELHWKNEPITAELIKRHAKDRVIVIVNTVARAQNLHRDLKEYAETQGIPLLCLHARFFKSDRDPRVAELKERFGAETFGPAILIATQVVEAGVDISCEHLFTELCPMNALLQRAGRCARFPNESGTVHVHPLPDEAFSYFPYGTRSGPDPSLAETESVLREQAIWTMEPPLVGRWVERVHGASDAGALNQFGWLKRLNDVRATIHTGLTHGGVDSVSEFIRPDDGSQVRAIIAGADDRPDTPAKRDALSVSRWSLRGLLQQEGESCAWYWDLGAENPFWRDLRTADDLLRAFVVCLSPSVAGYTREVGLRIGEPGTVVSPVRVPPKRPGHGSLHRETWAAHSRGVTREIEKRWTDEGDDALVGRGLAAVYGLSDADLRRALRACGLLHDVGKLQKRWQRWAKRYQELRNPSDVPTEPLAHTDFDPRNSTDRDWTRRAGTRGPHACASAWYGQIILSRLLPVPRERLPIVASACAAAIVSHHGGWIPETGTGLDVDPLITGWQGLLATVTGVDLSPNQVVALNKTTNQRGALAELLNRSVDPRHLEQSFALVAYLTRSLRLADQHATAEGGME